MDYILLFFLMQLRCFFLVLGYYYIHMNKKACVEVVLDALRLEISNLTREYKRVSDEAIHAPGFMESQHDTTKQELSYEAERIQRRMSVLEHTVEEVSSFVPTLQKNERIEVGALVRVEIVSDDTTKKFPQVQFLILPFGEGEEVAGTLVLSPHSPIFHDMHGKVVGELFSFRGITYRIESIE